MLLSRPHFYNTASRTLGQGVATSSQIGTLFSITLAIENQ